MENYRLKYINTAIVFQEIPDEVTLAINISGCPHHCEGCHSEYLWEYKGEYLNDNIKNILNQYGNMVTCICFMGGDQNIDDLIIALKYVKELGYKTCLYSGEDNIYKLQPLMNYLDYLKYGSYKQLLGGLDSYTTNQRMINLNTGKEIIFYKKGLVDVEN